MQILEIYMKKRRFLAAVITLAMLICSLASMTSCGDKGTQTPPTPTPTPIGPKEYTVSIKTEYGMPLSAIYILVHDEASSVPGSSVARAQTDRNGNATFELEGSKTYSLMLLDVPKGYLSEEKYYFDAERNADVALSSAPITDESIKDVVEYSVGDIIHDITLTDLNGKSHRISEVLAENDLLVLNFWFTSCGPCREEFPTLMNFYDKYKTAGLEIIAIDDNGDPVGSIRDYRVTVDGNATSLPFPTVKADDSTNGYGTCELLMKFGARAYPTSVFIDRAGMICYIHSGVIDSTELSNAIEHFTSENYEQRTFNRASDFK